MKARYRMVITSFVVLLIAGCGDRQERLTPAEVQFAAQSVRNDAPARTASPTSPTEPRNCSSLCDPMHPNYLCLIAGTLGSDRDKELNALGSLLTQPQPIVVSQAQLLSVFKLQNAGYDNARGNTTVTSNLLNNSGDWSTISANTIAGLKISLFVPTDVQYSYGTATGGFSLRETAPRNSIEVDFDDPVLQQTYGGRVLSIRFVPSFLVLTTTNGCVAYDPRPQLANGQIVRLFAAIRRRRLEAERIAGASPQRLEAVAKSYSKVSLFEDPCSPPRDRGGCGGCKAGYVHCLTDYGVTGSCVDYDACIKSGGEPTCQN